MVIVYRSVAANEWITYTIFVHKLIRIVFADVITIRSNWCADKYVGRATNWMAHKKNAKVILIIKQYTKVRH